MAMRKLIQMRAFTRF